MRACVRRSIINQATIRQSVSETLRNHIIFCGVLRHSLIDRTHCISCASATGPPSLQILDVFLVEISPAHILVRASIATFPRGDAVTLRPEIHPKPGRHVLLPLHAHERLLPSLDLLARLVKVLRRVVRRAERRPIEVVKHQVHVLGLFVLEVVANLYVAVHLDLDVSVGLS